MQLPNRIAVPALTILFLLFCLLATGCEQRSQAAASHAIPEVSTVTVQPRQIMLTTTLPGRTAAFRSAEIRPQVSGLVQKRLFTEGSDVTAGQVLYLLDAAPFEAALANAEANRLAALSSADRARSALKASIADVDRYKETLNLARSNRRRHEESYKDKVVSAIQLDQAVTAAKTAQAALLAAEAMVESNRDAIAAAEAAIQQAEAAVKTAKINLGYCQVKAPISGRIGRSNITEGAVVTAYQPVPLALIQQTDPVYVDVPQSTTELLRLKKAGLKQEGAEQNKVKLLLEDGSTYKHAGTLQFSDISVDPTTGSVILRIVFPNPEGMLLPGMFVQTVIREGVDEKAILIPQQGISRDQRGNPYALIVTPDNKVGMRSLTVDRAIGDQWLVKSGIKEGELVIMEGSMMLRPGTPVKAVPFKSPAKKDANPPQSAKQAS